MERLYDTKYKIMADWFYNNKAHAENAYNLLLNKKHERWNSFDSNAFKNYVEKCTHDNLNNPLDAKSGTTLLHAAVALDNKYALDILLENGANSNIEDVFGNTPLDLAIKNNNKKLVETLTHSSTHEKDKEIASLKEHNTQYIEDIVKHKESYETECKKRKRYEDETYDMRISYKTLQNNDLSLRKSIASEQHSNSVLKQNNIALSDENIVLKRSKVALEKTNKLLAAENTVLINDYKLLKVDNATLIDENRKIVKERNTFKNRYETLKESTKK